MAVQREIVDKDGNRLAVVQGGAGKSAVYGKTAEGEWVPLQVDADGRAVLNVGEVSATIGVIEQGAAGEDPWLVQLSGNDVVIGLLADRPPASEMRGRGYYAWDETDGHKLKYSDGTNWVVNK